MASLPTLKELRAMQTKDLHQEIAEHRASLSKMTLMVAAKSEKDTAKVRRLRKFVAQVHTVVSEKNNAAPALKKTSPTAKVSAPKNA